MAKLVAPFLFLEKKRKLPLTSQVKIALLGPESTGKSTLCEQLALHFGGDFTTEYAREYLTEINRDYLPSDLYGIAKGQIQKEKEKNNAPLLFCDTCLIVIKIWSEYKYGHTDIRVEKMLQTQRYYHYFLTYPDIAWHPDPLRENPKDRMKIYAQYLHFLNSQKLPFSIIKGKGEKRLSHAIEATKRIVDF